MTRIHVLLFATTVPFVIVVSAFSIHSVKRTANGIFNPNGLLCTHRSTSVLYAGLFGQQDSSTNHNQTYISPTSDWHIYVDQSKASLDRGGATTLDAFYSLCHLLEDDLEIQILPAILPKPVGGGKGPWIRCIWNTQKKEGKTRPSPNLDVSNVDSVDKVYRILTHHLGVKNVSRESCECLKWKNKGNTFLESGDIKPTIDAYNEALSICEAYQWKVDNNETKATSLRVLKQQEGIILLLRASAFLLQARSHKKLLQGEVVENEEGGLLGLEMLKNLLSENLTPSPNFQSSGETTSNEFLSTEDILVTEATERDPVISFPDKTSEAKNEDSRDEASTEPLTVEGPSLEIALDETTTNTKAVDARLVMLRKAKLRKLHFRHGLYQTSLLQAARDALKATEVLPNYPAAWLRAGEILSDLWKIKESQQYYERAISIDSSMRDSLTSTLQQLEEREVMVNQARGSWPDDTVQLALDITE